MSRNERWRMGCLVPSAGWWEHPVDFSPCEAAPPLLLADEFPWPHFLSLLWWVSLFPWLNCLLCRIYAWCLYSRRQGCWWWEVSCWSIFPVAEGGDLIKVAHFPIKKRNLRFLWSRNTHLHLFLVRFSGSFSHMSPGEARDSKAARALRGVLQVEKGLHSIVNPISAQLIICV